MLSIIFVNYKTSKDLDICLSSIQKFEKKYQEYEYIIVDNNSGDNNLENLKVKYPFIHLIYAEKNGGFAYGNNIGIKASKGDILFLLNPDTYITDNSIEILFNKLSEDENLDFIGPQLFYPNGENQSFFQPKSYLTLWKLFCTQFFLDKIFQKSHRFNSYFKTYMDYSSSQKVESVDGAALMFKKKVIEKMGYLDESYFMYFEEIDFCFQAHKYKCNMLYYPKAKVFHSGGLISESNWTRSTKDYIISFKNYFRKNFNDLIYKSAWVVMFSGSLLRTVGLSLKKNSTKHGYYKLFMKHLLKSGNR
jgi:GT2 family glycosyltransferase